MQDGQARLGFNNGYGGYPFPILSSDPAQAGAQAIWNHEAHWFGPYLSQTPANTWWQWRAGSRNRRNLNYRCDFYQQGAPRNRPATTSAPFSCCSLDRQQIPVTRRSATSPPTPTAPAGDLGPVPGQGRVRKTPNEQFDTHHPIPTVFPISMKPTAFTEPNINMIGSCWAKKKYSSRTTTTSYYRQRQGPAFAKYYDPEICPLGAASLLVVEATLHPVSATSWAAAKCISMRDDWTIHITDTWDNAGNILHLTYLMNCAYRLFGTIYANACCIICRRQYATVGGSYGDAPFNRPGPSIRCRIPPSTPRQWRPDHLTDLTKNREGCLP